MHLNGQRETDASGEAEVTASDARNRLGELIDRTLAGERIILSRHGKRIAALISARDLETLEGAA